ncbi:hypothetical protein [Donghicola tyrosinivorans]|uniref:Uncharacterized protein n=1 Tax=Donghicola tyrosinivorans TaxID=1652492 RepID=A0A2T0X040_9RHOB|nr:hypothetical protein [Donghicola tyrosinivorans]MEC9196705.1 hypothetical protein [Pseudomonadota bacterium]MEE3071825.1 hypothetical protein [Pseudomonadota bacterium]PRY92316.1 hypothetical protein CLV74_102231 [Donghicola tyrosinivorans]
MIIGIIGLIVAFALVVIFRNPATRNCRWREDRRRDKDGLRFYRCVNCGAEVWDSPKHSPKTCHNPDKKGTS